MARLRPRIPRYTSIQERPWPPSPSFVGTTWYNLLISPLLWRSCGISLSVPAFRRRGLNEPARCALPARMRPICFLLDYNSSSSGRELWWYHMRQYVLPWLPWRSNNREKRGSETIDVRNGCNIALNFTKGKPGMEGKCRGTAVGENVYEYRWVFGARNRGSGAQRILTIQTKVNLRSRPHNAGNWINDLRGCGQVELLAYTRIVIVLE